MLSMYYVCSICPCDVYFVEFMLTAEMFMLDESGTVQSSLCFHDMI